MSDSNPEGNTSPSSTIGSAATEESSSNGSDRFGDVMGQVNEALAKIDWSQMGKYGKAVGIVAVVILAQVLIKVVIDTINFFPIVPGLLELLGVVVLAQWSLQNLTTSEKRNELVDRVQKLREEYLG